MKNYLFFGNSEKERVIAEIQNQEEMWIAINTFLEEKNYKSYYYRIWIEEEDKLWKLIVDVGSWCEFFYVYFDTQEQAKEFIKIKEHTFGGIR